MSPQQLSFISFEEESGKFRAFLPIETLLSIDSEPEPVLQWAAEFYQSLIASMRLLVEEIEHHRRMRKPVPAKKIWELGQAIFALTNGLGQRSLQVDGLYDHLARDLSVKEKWLEKVVIFRRYIPDRNAIPDSLNWGRCEKGTRRKAQELFRSYSQK